MLELDKVLDIKVATSLLQKFREEEGAYSSIDASKVEYATTPCLQIIASVMQKNPDLRLVSPSEPFIQIIKDMGLETVLLEQKSEEVEQGDSSQKITKSKQGRKGK